MPRSMWRGVISLGMVSVPVRLYVATESTPLSFRQLCAAHVSAVRIRRWCSAGGHEVPYSEVVRGYEVSPDSYVVIQDSDLETLPHPSARTIAVSAFVPQDAIRSGLFFKSAYYVEPEAVARRAYRLLTRVLVETATIAIARIALRDRQHLCCLHAVEDLLLLNTLHWPDEIRPPERVQEQGETTIRPKELQMAKALVQSLAVESFDPRHYRDEYREALMEAVNVKIEGAAVLRASRVEVAPVMDLMEALVASVKAARRGRTARQGATRQARRGS